MCNWEDSVSCNLNKPPTTQPVVVENEDYDYNNNEYHEDGESCEEGEYSHSDSSCSSFYHCVNGKKLQQDCYEGLHWNRETETCDWPAAAGCHIGRVLNMGDSDGECQEGTLAPAPDNCAQYLFCVHGKLQTHSCQVGTAWDNKLRVCNFPDLVDCEAAGDNLSQQSPEVIAVSGVEEVAEQDKSSDNDFQVIESLPAGEEVDVNVEREISGDYKIVCYFTNWAWYRPGAGKFRAESVDPDLCTHIVYGFAVLDSNTLTIKPHDTWADIDNSKTYTNYFRAVRLLITEYYTKLTDYKKRGVKVSLAIGGWNDSEGDKYSRLVNSPEARRRFTRHVVNFLQKYNFDGLDLDWEYPSCWQVGWY